MAESDGFISLDFERQDLDAMQAAAMSFFDTVVSRRSVRHFSTDPVPLETVRRCIDAAAQAPSGANKQPWTFVMVTDPDAKRRIRQAAEKEERAFYEGRAPEEWLNDLRPLGTDANKPFLTEAPVLIIVFAQSVALDGAKHYYVQQSVGLATGFLIAALHHAGLATLTHTPSPMGFLAELCGRPKNERGYILLPVGYPAEGCEVPAITRKERDGYLVEL